MRYKLAFAVAGAAPIILLAFSTGSPVRRTGGVDGGQDCTTCHNLGGAANSDSRGSVTIEGVQDYVGGQGQTLRVTIRHPDAQRWGFQLTARFVTGNGTLRAGTLQPVDQLTRVVCDSPAGSADNANLGSPGPCSADRLEWIEHANAQQTQAGIGSYTYNFSWSPPAEENGAVMFYVSAVAAWGSGSARSERVYTATKRILVSTDAGCGFTNTPVPRSAVNAGPHAGPFAPNSMVEIYGSFFQSSARKRQADVGDLVNGTFPTQLGCIKVLIGGQPAPITYLQQDQINVQAPSSLNAGPADVVVIANPGRPDERRSVAVPATVQSPAPSFFTFGTTNSIAARFGNGQVVARPALVPGARPAKPRETIALYGTGFGATDPSWQAGQIPTDAARVPGGATVTIGGQQATVEYVGLSPTSISGLYQINVRIPDGIADGDQPVVATIGGVKTQDGAFVPIQVNQ